MKTLSLIDKEISLINEKIQEYKDFIVENIDKWIGYFLAALFVIIITVLSSMIIKKSLTKLLEDKIEKTKFSFLKNIIGFIVYFLGIMMIFQIIPPLRGIGNKILTGSAVLTAIIGLGFQKSVSDFISSISILLSRPFRLGDIIELSNGIIGKVEEINLRHTVIRDFSNKFVFVPNGKMNEEIIINNDIGTKKMKKVIEFTISYDANIEKATHIIKEEILKHPFILDERTPEEKKNKEEIAPVEVTSWNDSSISLKAFLWVGDFGQSFKVERDLLKSIKLRFDDENIEIPFPYRTIVFKNKLPN